MATSNLGTGGGGFPVSPGVNVSEIDLTTVVPSTSTTEGAISGVFRWGPVDKYLLVTSENELADRYAKPTTFNAETWFTAANFLSYGNKLYVSRAANTSVVFNAVANSGAVTVADSVVKNEDDYESVTLDTDVHFIAKYPGTLGNSLKVSACYNANQFNSTIDENDTSEVAFSLSVGSNTGTIVFGSTSTSDASDQLAANNTVAALSVGDYVKVGNATIGHQYLKINNVGSVTMNTSSFSKTVTATINTGANSTTLVTLTSGNTSGFDAGDTVTAASNTGVVNTDIALTISSVVNSSALVLSASAIIANGTTTLLLTDADAQAQTAYVTLTFDTAYKLGTTWASNTINRYWEFYSQVDTAPGQSDYVAEQGNTSAQDEMHVVVADEDGVITGNPGTVLEVFSSLSRASDAKKTGVNSTNYWKNVLNDNSKWVWAGSDVSGAVSNTALNVTSVSTSTPSTFSMVGGTDGSDETAVPLQDIMRAADLFKDKDTVDVSLIMTGKSRGGTHGEQMANYLIDNIALERKDCVVFVSPDKDDVVNNTIDPAEDVTQFRDSVRSTSFGVMDSGYKYQYDKYNDVYRWIPLNGDIAGLCARTDSNFDPWFSPAGLNRGQIKNVIRLAFNPNQAQRDTLYKKGVNPVVTFPGQGGPILYGDKTLQAKPSAFDRINVRRLFIVLEKVIASASKYSMFEFNDAFTRAQFRNLVEPFLRDVQGRRGITDFRVVCDETNNTQEVIDSYRFVGDIYVKPSRSINFVQLNFVAVRSGIEFSEIVGRF